MNYSSIKESLSNMLIENAERLIFMNELEHIVSTNPVSAVNYDFMLSKLRLESEASVLNEFYQDNFESIEERSVWEIGENLRSKKYEYDQELEHIEIIAPEVFSRPASEESKNLMLLRYKICSKTIVLTRYHRSLFGGDVEDWDNQIEDTMDKHKRRIIHCMPQYEPGGVLNPLINGLHGLYQKKIDDLRASEDEVSKAIDKLKKIWPFITNPYEKRKKDKNR